MAILGFTGHRAIPSDGYPVILEQLRGFLRRQEGPLVARCSLAAGADQMFAEAIVEQAGVLQVVIPSDDFLSTLGSEEAEENYLRLLKAATAADCLPFTTGGEDAYEATGHSIVDGCDHLLAIWDGEPATSRGSTGDVVQYAQRRNVPVTVLWAEGVKR